MGIKLKYFAVRGFVMRKSEAQFGLKSAAMHLFQCGGEIKWIIAQKVEVYTSSRYQYSYRSSPLGVLVVA